jgi:hypothetical protein
MIRYLKHEDIDKEQWNIALRNCQNRIVYATSWYLDIVSPDWEALVEDNYKSIMPLPAKKRYGLAYLIQPLFVQQLGIFSPDPVNHGLVDSYLQAIPKKFLWQCFYWNSKNPINHIPGSSVRINYELSLDRTYESIFSDYSENTKRNLVKAGKAAIHVEKTNNFCGFHECYQLHNKLSPNEIEVFQLQQIIDASVSKNTGQIMLARDAKKEIVAGAFFLTEFDSIIYLTSFVYPKGYSHSAMFLLMDDLIKRYSSSRNLFDFEGSMVPGIARFFSGFGAVESEYFEYKRHLFSKLMT